MAYMESRNVKVRITFTEDVLGTASANHDIHAEFIAAKAPDASTMAQEIEAIGVDGVVEKAMTVFPRDKEGNPIFWDYQIKGFFKGTCGFLRRVPNSKASKLKSYKKVLDGLMFVYPRQIPIAMSGEMGNCQRPLRAETMQGERVALANSESVPAGSSIEIEVECYTKEIYDFVMEALEYGKKSGIGQWRNSGAGRFTYELIE